MNLVHSLVRQVREASDELRMAQGEVLADRKLVERAKALFMQHRLLSEELGYQLVRRAELD